MRLLPPGLARIPRAAFILGVALALLSPLCGAAPCGSEAPDWIAQADSLYARPAPLDCATVRQSPPDFIWPPYPGATRYEFELTDTAGKAQSVPVDANWIAWPRELSPGDYTWRVRPLLAKAGAPAAYSRPRRFTVAPGALRFIVPPGAELSARASAIPHPRSLPIGRENQLWRTDLATRRQAAVRSLGARVTAMSEMPLVSPDAGSGAAPAAVQVQAVTWPELTRTLEACLKWVLSGQAADRLEARRRVLGVAAWDATGPSGYAANDSVAMETAWTLALAYDWLYAELSAAERSTLLQAIAARAEPAYRALAGPRGSYAQTPYDSHGALSLAQLAGIGTLLAGELPQAALWLEAAAPLYAHYLYPWGPEDGGHANGTTYALWDLDRMLFIWDVLRRGTRLDLRDKPWARQFGRLLAYFLPPGAPAGLFGDGAEMRRDEEWGRIAKAYAARLPDSLMRWYTAQLRGGEPSLVLALLAPPAPPAGALPSGTAPSALIASTGWVAMHASLDKPPPFSVYFKSSPFGSYNHAHADQNSFVIHAGGEAMAVASGVYDWYASPHWRQWYAQTRASNAITFDGGQGQALGPRGDGLLNASGRILSFAAGAKADLVVGDATAAYGGTLNRAVRALAYVRPGTVVIFDDLRADTPRRWEWNLHADNPLRLPGALVHTITGRNVTLCFRVFAAPGAVYSTAHGFPVPPAEGASNARGQWHAVYQTQASLDARFVAVFDLDCARLANLALPEMTGETMRIRIAGQTISFDTRGRELNLTPGSPEAAALPTAYTKGRPAASPVSVPRSVPGSVPGSAHRPVKPVPLPGAPPP